MVSGGETQRRRGAARLPHSRPDSGTFVRHTAPMDPMLHAPRRRPRPPHWRVPVLCAVLAIFLLALWAADGASTGPDPAVPDARVATHEDG